MLAFEKKQKIYTVSKLNKDIRFLLERNFAALSLTGEISNFVSPASGHWYFTLKDDNAQVRAAMWRGNNRAATFKPKNGDQVLVRARISLYEPRGDYQLVVEHIEAAGTGLLKQEFEALQMRLAAEGLFSTENKQVLPENINKIGVITSATGAAFKDILTVLKRRAPQLEVILYPAQVQGTDAHTQLIAQIKLANQRNEVDVLILGRGGGSLEDLWCFNHEQLARTIFASNLPIVSAVGHEIDTTISDFVADVRAATPSAAAELVSPDTLHIHNQINTLVNRLNRAYRHYLITARQQHKNKFQALKIHHPKYKLQQQIQKLDELRIRLDYAADKKNQLDRQLFSQLYPKLLQQNPANLLKQKSLLLTGLNKRLDNAISKQLDKNKNQLGILAAKLNSTSPLAVLGRGYSITEFKTDKNTQQILTTVEQIETGTELCTQLADGKVISQVVKIE